MVLLFWIFRICFSHVFDGTRVTRTVIMKSDGERILNIMEAIRAMIGKLDKDTVTEQSPKGENSSNGAAEQSNLEV